MPCSGERAKDALDYPAKPRLALVGFQRNDWRKSVNPAGLENVLERREDVGEDATFIAEDLGDSSTPDDEVRFRFGEELAKEARKSLADGEEGCWALDLVCFEPLVISQGGLRCEGTGTHRT